MILLSCLYIGTLVFSAIYDIKYYKVLNVIHFIIVFLALCYKNSSGLEFLIEGIYSFLFFFFLLFISSYTNCMGGGDIKFIFSNMIFLGFLKGCQALFLSCVLLVFHNLKLCPNAKIAMVPYLSMGFGIVFLSSFF